MNNDLEQLIQYAKAENWKAMDALLPKVCNDEEIIQWSLGKGIQDPDGNIRDLAVSLLEKSTYHLNENDIDFLETLIQTDKNKYVQFRAAFALFTRGIRSESVMSRMHESLTDEDVKGIAKSYLGETI